MRIRLPLLLAAIIATSEAQAHETDSAQASAIRHAYGHIREVELEQSLAAYPKPWTVARLLQWSNSPKREEDKIPLIRALASTHSPEALPALITFFEGDAFYPRIAAAYALHDFFIGSPAEAGGTEQVFAKVKKWLNENRNGR